MKKLVLLFSLLILAHETFASGCDFENRVYTKTTFHKVPASLECDNQKKCELRLLGSDGPVLGGMVLTTKTQIKSEPKDLGIVDIKFEEITVTERCWDWTQVITTFEAQVEGNIYLLQFLERY
jgi:hypothetical protein